MATPISTDLHVLAQRVVSLGALAVDATSARELAAVGEALTALAGRNVVVLPTIDPERDDVAHWRGLADRKLVGENGADAWNLAAGLHVAAERQALRAADQADFATIGESIRGAGRAS